MNKNIDELKKLPFENALELLEETVEKMENGNLPLDQMISCFEQGNALKNICSDKLNNLEKKIELLVKEDSQGGEWQEFDAINTRNVAVQPAVVTPVSSLPVVNLPTENIDNLVQVKSKPVDHSSAVKSDDFLF